MVDHLNLAGSSTLITASRTDACTHTKKALCASRGRLLVLRLMHYLIDPAQEASRSQMHSSLKQVRPPAQSEMLTRRHSIPVCWRTRVKGVLVTAQSTSQSFRPCRRSRNVLHMSSMCCYSWSSSGNAAKTHTAKAEYLLRRRWESISVAPLDLALLGSHGALSFPDNTQVHRCMSV